MAAVGSPQPPVLAAHHDQGVKERGRLIDLRRQALGVGGRQVALEGRRLHGAERHTRQEQRAAPERLMVGADGCASRLAHQRHECGDLLAVERHGNLRRIQSACGFSRRQAPAGGGALAPYRTFCNSSHGNMLP